MRHLLSLVLLCFSSVVLASVTSARFDRFSVEQGLSANSISGIVQDHQGFLWFASKDGLNRYDGYHFKVYRHNQDDEGSISGNWIESIYVDSQGVLWLGVGGGGLNRYDNELDSFEHFRHDPERQNSLSGSQVQAIVEDQQGVLWVGTEKGLNRFDRQTNTFTRFTNNSTGNSISHDNVKSLFVDKLGDLWVGTFGGGLNRFDMATGKFEHFIHDATNPNSLPNDNVWTIHQDKQGAVWMGTENGLARFDQQSRQFKVFRHQNDNPLSISNNNVWSIVNGDNDNLWIGSFGGLNLYHQSNDSFERFNHNPGDLHSLGHDKVSSLYTDSTGVLWVGTHGGGVSKNDTKRTRFGHFRHQSSNPYSLSHNSVKAIVKNQQGVLWVGTDKGLNRYDQTSGQFKVFNHKVDNPTSISDDDIYNLLQDNRGNLWIGTRSGGLNRYDRQTNTFEHFKHQPDNPNSISADEIWSLHQDRQGVIWVGTLKGLDRFDVARKQFKSFQPSSEDPTSLSSSVVSALLEDSSGYLWVGTLYGGLNRFDRKTQTFTHYRFDDNNKNSLGGDMVMAIFEDSQGNLWVCTYGGGLNLLDTEKGTFTRFSEKDGLANNGLYGMAEDSEGFLWISTNKGLSKFDYKNLSFKNYTVADGLQSNEFNYGAYFGAADGEMFFGGINGFNRFYPKDIKPLGQAPNVVLTDFLLFNKSVPIAKAGHSTKPQDKQQLTLTKAINAVEGIELNYLQSLISIEFTATDFTSSMSNQYAYKLQGWDQDWIITDANNRRATYTNIPAGDYVLRVKASNAYGIWNDSGKSLNVSISPPPWETWWAYTMYVVAFLAMVLLFVYRQHKKVLAHQRRAKEQKAINQQLMQVDKLKDDFLANTSHELRTPLNGIIGLTESLIDGVTGKLPAATNENLSMIVDSAKRLAHMVNDILDFSKLKSKDIPLYKRSLDLHSVVDITMKMTKVLIRENSVELCNDVSSQMSPVEADEDRLQQVLFNLLGNAAKFTHEGKITISAQQVDSKITVKVTDTGIGIEPSKLDSIFDSFEQADGSTTREYGGTGLGLTITRQLVELHGGRMSVESTPGVGSTFAFTLSSTDEPVSENADEPRMSQFGLSQKTIEPIEAVEVVNQTTNINGIEQGVDPFKLLLVDDEPINLQVLSNHLCGHNYKVTRALNGQEALSALDEHHFDMVILDIMMPKMSGYEVARRMRQTYSADVLPIIMLTAKNQVADLVEGFSCGANDYLAKPFSKDELLARIRTQLNLMKINAASARFLPNEFLKMLQKESIVDVRLGDQIQSEMTILFLDIRAFTELSEKMTPKENFDFLNEYLGYVIPSIKANGGFIDKYIGDAVMALFPGTADSAVAGSVCILKQIQVYNDVRQKRNESAISIGIGLHTGNLMLGTIGNDQRMDGTVISDAVNLASRIEGLTKMYGTSLLISDSCYKQLSDQSPFTTRILGKVQVKGKDQAIQVVEVLDGELPTIFEAKKSTLATFNEALEYYYNKDFEEAATGFKHVLKANPTDQTAILYHRRSALNMVDGVNSKWDGTEKMDSK